MIFPILAGFLSPRFAPITFLLFSLNLFVFASTFDDYDRAERKIEAITSDSQFMETQGNAFAVMILKEPAHFSKTLRSLAETALDGDRSSKKLLGTFGIRNVEFMNHAEEFEFGGDQVALAKWRKRFSELKEIEVEHPSYMWGVSRLKKSWVQFISYQFSHGGFSHLASNMLFLVLFGAFVETRLGSSFVILTYVGGGVLGALSYSVLSGISSSPLVGASAAVSALISLVGFAWLGRGGVRFFFWLLPLEGYFGFRQLPSWLIFLLLLLPDLSGYLSAPRDFGSIAYSAHLGGAVWGGVMAFFLYIGWFEKEKPLSGEEPPADSSENMRQAG